MPKHKERTRLSNAARAAVRRAMVSTPALRGYYRRHAWRRMAKGTATPGYTFKPFLDHRCVFVHIPKAAGIAIAKSLFGNMAGGHWTVQQYEYIFRKVLRVRDFDQYFKFTFTRNPWDRVVSAYFFLRSGGWNTSGLPEYPVRDFTLFSDFVKNWLTEENARSVLHFRPQVDFVRDRYGHVGVDFVGRMESLEEDFEYVRRRLGIEAQLARTNQSQHLAYQDLYDDKSKEIVRSVYHSDIEVFGYSFE